MIKYNIYILYIMSSLHKRNINTAKAVLSQKIIAYQEDYNRLTNNVFLTENRFNAIVSSIMKLDLNNLVQSKSINYNNTTINEFIGASPGPPSDNGSLINTVLKNVEWKYLSTWINNNPKLNNYIFVYQASYNDLINFNFRKFIILNDDYLKLKLNVPISQTSNITIDELLNSNYNDDVTTYLNSVLNALPYIFNQSTLPQNNSEYNFKPIVSNVHYPSYKKNEPLNQGTVGVWREEYDSSLEIEPRFFIAGYGSSVIGNYRNPCYRCQNYKIK
jgi:hypothetical protein